MSEEKKIDLTDGLKGNMLSDKDLGQVSGGYGVRSFKKENPVTAADNEVDAVSMAQPK